MNCPLRFALTFFAAVVTALPPARGESIERPYVRKPAVAGLFYPADRVQLGTTVDRLLNAAKTENLGGLKALICPHAGYSYSGPVAASGFGLLRGTTFQTVILLGPSHYALLDAAEVADASAYRTPLGDVPISPKARQLGSLRPFALHPPATVERPDWAGNRGPAATTEGDRKRADTWEHADEVELPFLQRTLGRFALVPVVMGDVDPTAAARALDSVLDDSTLIVVSSDLSHYHPYAEARKLDAACVDAVCKLDVERMERQEACGRIPILTLLHLARQRGWQPRLLDLRNSGDTAGDKSRVVGYAAIAFFAATDPAVSPADRVALLSLARTAVRTAAEGASVPPIPRNLSTGAFAVRRGVFVTLTRHGELRGCIGNLAAVQPLSQAVVENARRAAVHDPRFAPVRPREVDELKIEISVLSDPQPLSFSSPEDLVRKLTAGVDGVVLHIAAGTATYLPQVWEQLPDKIEFLDTLAEKAGGRAGDWRAAGTRVETYRVESFAEQ